MRIYNNLRINYARNPHDADALRALKEYLDVNGCKMPMPKYKYDRDDIATWRYIENHKGRDATKLNHLFNPQMLNEKKSIRY